MYKHASILNKTCLKTYLLKEDNSYSTFILERIDKQFELSPHLDTHIHHIIPHHWGGSDSSWNLIKLSIEEHAYAHKLLYENYKSFYDLGACKLIQNQIGEGFHLIRKANQFKMKKNLVGLYNSEVQRELGKRLKKKRAPFARNSFIKVALKNGFVLEWVETQEIITIGPQKYCSLTDVMEKLMTFPQMKNEREICKNTQKKEKYSGITALTRTLTGHVAKKTNRRVYSFKGWRVLGLFLS